MKRKIALILVSLMLANVFLVSCSENTEVKETKKPDSGAETPVGQDGDEQGTGEQGTETEINEEDLLYDSLVPYDYDGYKFRFLTSWSNYGITYMDVEGMTANIINDTVYKRNRAIESLLDITIYEEGDLEFREPMARCKKMVLAGSDEADVIFTESFYAASVVGDKFMHNLYDIGDVNWENPWWEDTIREFFTINDKLYFTYSPMHLHYYESLVTPLFNKDIAREKQLENIYETVKEGKWTIDKMASLAQGIVDDKNGDGVMNVEDDLYGIAASMNLVVYMPLAAGCRYTEKGDDGKIVFVGNNERLISTVEKLNGIFGGTDRVIGTTEYSRLFQENHSLFFLDVLGRVKDFRAIDMDFGIIPLPKYDEEQADYISSTYKGGSVMLVPSSNKAYDEIGTILEYFGAYSYRDLIPAYYEINIQGQQTRDEESVEMLEIMLEKITADLDVIYGWGDVEGKVNKAVSSGEGFVSAIASSESSVAKDIEILYKNLEKRAK